MSIITTMPLLQTVRREVGHASEEEPVDTVIGSLAILQASLDFDLPGTRRMVDNSNNGARLGSYFSTTPVHGLRFDRNAFGY